MNGYVELMASLSGHEAALPYIKQRQAPGARAAATLLLAAATFAFDEVAEAVGRAQIWLLGPRISEALERTSDRLLGRIIESVPVRTREGPPASCIWDGEPAGPRAVPTGRSGTR